MHAMRLDEACAAPVWDAEFWDAMEGAEAAARRALMALWEDSMEGGGCSCDTHIVNTVLEAMFPTFTAQVIRLSQPGVTNAPS